MIRKAFKISENLPIRLQSPKRCFSNSSTPKNDVRHCLQSQYNILDRTMQVHDPPAPATIQVSRLCIIKEKNTQMRVFSFWWTRQTLIFIFTFVKIIVLPWSGRWQTTCHRQVISHWFKPIYPAHIKKRHP